MTPPPEPPRPATGGAADDDGDVVDLDDVAVSAYLDGVASPAEAARVEADPALRRRLDEFRTVAAVLADDDAGGPGMTDATLGAALDRARAGALQALTGGREADPAPPPHPTSLVERLGRRRAHRARWVVQVAGLAAAALVAVGAAALLRSPSDDRPAGGETAAAQVDRARPEAGDDATLSAQRAAGDAGPSDGAEKAPTLTPSLGTHATVEDLLVSLGGRPGAGGSPSPAASVAAAEGSGAPSASTAAAPATVPATTAPMAAAGSASCPTQGGDVLGTAVVAGRALLVLERRGAGGERRLIGIDPVGCTAVFDQPR